MNVVGFNVFTYKLPLVKPLVVNGITISVRRGWLIRLRMDETREGWGEVAPWPGLSRESPGEVADQLGYLCDHARELIPAWWSDGPSRDQVTFSALHSSVRMGIESAFLECRAAGAPGGENQAIPVNGLIPNGSTGSLDRAGRLVEQGYRCLKLKVGRGSEEEELDFLARLRQRVGPGVAIRLDANRAWKPEQALAFTTAAAPLDIQYIEEPLVEANLLPDGAKDLPITVALDETLQERSEENWETWSNVGAVVLKPTLLGGLARSRALAERGLEAGLEVVVSSVYESGVGLLNLACFAQEMGLSSTAHGLDTYHVLDGDLLVRRIDMHQGRLDIRRGCITDYGVNYEMLEQVQ